jgi:hypothetical protein
MMMAIRGKVGNPLVGQGPLTGFATFNNTQAPIVADAHTGNVYTIYAAGQPSVQKGTSAAFNNIIVSRSTDKGLTWTADFSGERGSLREVIFSPSHGSQLLKPDEMRRPVSGRDAVRSQVIDVL